MSDLRLSRLQRVPLRTFWQDEARDFTPWLAGEENIVLLGETIGVDLEVQEQEARVGPFRADILCRDTVSDSLVLVENQLERTDHTHLGQLFTYAAGLDAVTVIWIAERFTEEHRAALDWLNRITHEGFHFFGIEIELWQIDQSALAPKFSLVSKPNDWSKTVREAAAATKKEMTAAEELRLEYWTSFAEYLRERGGQASAPGKATTSHWVTWGVGKTGFNLGANVYAQYSDGCGASVYIWISADEEAGYFAELYDDRESIHAELGFRSRLAREAGQGKQRDRGPGAAPTPTTARTGPPSMSGCGRGLRRFTGRSGRASGR